MEAAGTSVRTSPRERGEATAIAVRCARRAPGRVPLAVLTALPDGERLLRLEGPLPRGWLRRLTAGCARHGVSVLSGGATTAADGTSRARIVLAPRWRTDELPDLLTWVAAADEPLPAPLPKILDFELFDRPGAGVVVLEVHAWESVGLLAGVLQAAESAGLFPRELFLETEQECAFHQVVLTAEDGGTPSTPRVLRLSRALRSVISAA